MDLINRYLQAVAFWLPEEQRKDIVAELSVDIQSEIEDREAALERPLTNSELEELLKRRGNPLLVAQRYLPQRFLIGPMLFPIYSLVLKILFLGYAVPALVGRLCLLMFSPGYWAGHPGIEKLSSLSSIWTVTWSFFIAVTVIFAALERLQQRAGPLDHWDPRKLKPVRDLSQVPRAQSGGELAAALLFIAWWGGWVQIPQIPGIQIVAGPIWHALYWPIAVVVLASGLLAIFQLVRPAWTPGRAGMRLLINLASVGLAVSFASFHPWITIIAPGLSAFSLSGVENSINGTLAAILLFAVVTHTLRAIQDLRRLGGKEPLHHWAIVALAGA